MNPTHEAWLEQRQEMALEAPEYICLHQVYRVARKDYICDDCHKPIAKGSKYVSHAMRYDGEFRHHRAHAFNGQCAYDDDRYTDTPEPEDEWR